MSEPTPSDAPPHPDGLRVLVATDGSEESLEAIRQAKAVLSPAQWELVTVIPDRIDPNADATGFAGPTMDEDEARDLDHERLVDADGIVSRTARALGPVPVTANVLRGDPGPSLCRHAEITNADVLVVGAHDRGLLSRALLGSVTDHVTRNAPCPVLVIPG